MIWPSLLDRLPSVRGKLIENASLSDITWLRVGGLAQVLFLPADAIDLACFLEAAPHDIEVRVLGAGSNVLVLDGGLPGVTVKLTPAFGEIKVLAGNRIRAGAAALDRTVARVAAKAGIAGFEFYECLPGAIGGALRMNAGCYGAETGDRLVEVVALDRRGCRIIASLEELGYAYRHSAAPDDWIFIEALFEGTKDDPAAVTMRMRNFMVRREASQPIRGKTAGCTFKNPAPETSGGRSAWQLVAAAGWRGKPIGGARFSEQHCNFLINDGTATASDLETLGETVRAEVKDRFGVELHWEVKCIGVPK